jgi:hypothetical protein
MNVIAWDTAYCLYPRATLLDRVALVIHPVIPLDTPAVRKYAERGYRLFNAPHAYQRAQLAPVFFPDAPRWVDDARGWAVPLETAGLAPPPFSATSVPITRDPVAHNSWSLRWDDEKGVRMDHFAVNPGVFRFGYLCQDEGFLKEVLLPFVSITMRSEKSLWYRSCCIVQDPRECRVAQANRQRQEHAR